MQILLVWLFVQIYYIPSTSNWIEATSTLSLAEYSMSVGFYNDTVFLLGGNYKKRRIMRYHSDTDTFTFTDPGFSVDVYGEAQFWVQQRHNLYMISPLKPSTLIVFNMINEQLTSDLYILPLTVSDCGCLAYSQSTNHLLVTGGYDGNMYLTALQALDLSAYIWIQNTSSMLEARGYHACIVNNNRLWIFGGYNGVVYMSTNEHIDITNVVNNTWRPLSFQLSENTRGARAVSIDQEVYIIGGRNSNKAHNIVYILDTNTEIMKVSSDALAYVVALSSPVITGSVISVFGGWIQGFNLPTNAWMYYIVPTKNPTIFTTNPTQAPSDAPHIITTMAPSQIPSQNPAVSFVVPTKRHTQISTGTNNDECDLNVIEILIHFTYEILDKDISTKLVEERLNNITSDIIGNVNLSNSYSDCILSAPFIVVLSSDRTVMINISICACNQEVQRILLASGVSNIEHDFITKFREETVFIVDINGMIVMVSGIKDAASTTWDPRTTSDYVYYEELAKYNNYFLYVMIIGFFISLVFGFFLVIWYRQEVTLHAEISVNQANAAAVSEEQNDSHDTDGMNEL